MSEEKKEPPSVTAVFGCGVGDLCKDGKPHQWDGPTKVWNESNGARSEASTCSKCGCDALSWSLWNGP